MEGAATLSIVIINYNTAVLLDECLDRIYRFAPDVHAIIVIDNASQDGSSEMVMAKYPRAALIANPVNVGFPKAVNQGLRLAHTPFVFILNGDIWLEQGAVEALLAYVAANPATGISAPAQYLPDGAPILTVHHFPTFRREVLRHVFFSDIWRYRLQGQNIARSFAAPQTVDWVMGAALLVRQSCIEDIGLMDEHVFMYGEEYDWAFRAHKAGWRTAIVPAARVIHHKSASADKAFNTRRLSIVTASNYYFMAKHFGFWRLPFFVMLQLIGSFFRLILAGLFVIGGKKAYKSQALGHWQTIQVSLKPETYQKIWQGLTPK